MAINTVLGGDDSPSDRLVISGGTASGNTIVHVTNVGGVGAETTNGIPVVEAVNGATTSPGAFALPAGELRAGAFDYDLFRGGVGGSQPQMTGSCAPTSSRRRSVRGRGAGGRCALPIPPFPIDPPPNPLPPGVGFPIIGPELATYGVVQPLARQLGLSILGTLDDRSRATPTSRMVAPLRLRSRRIACRPGRGRRLGPARSSRPQSGGGSSAKRSTTTIKPSPIPAPTAIWEASRAVLTFCAAP